MIEPEVKSWSWVIRPASSLPDLKIGELWHYKDLLLRFVKRDLIVNYRQTILGPLWVVIEPLISTFVYFAIFTGVMKIPVGNTPPLLFYLSGTIIWIYFSDTITGISGTFQHNASLLNKVYFPRLILPLSVAVSKFSRMVIQLILLAGIYIFYLVNESQVQVTWNILLVPVLLLLTVLFTFGSGLILAALAARYRDVQNLMVFLLKLMLFATPVFYPYSIVNSEFRWLIGSNPLTAILESFRSALFNTGSMNAMYLIYATISTIVLLVIGLVAFGRVEQNVIDTI